MKINNMKNWLLRLSLLLFLIIMVPNYALAQSVPTASISSFKLDSEFYVGKSTELLSGGLATNKILYQYWIRDNSVGKWELLRNYSEDPKFIWTPNKPGSFRLEVHVKDSLSGKSFDSNAFKDITVQTPQAKVTSFNPGSEFYVAGSHTLTASGTAPNKVLYQYWARDYSAGKWLLLRNYSEDPNFAWTPDKPGKYRIEVHIKDSNSSKTFDDSSYKDIEVKVPRAKVSTFDLPSQFYVGKTNTIKSSATGAQTILYQYWIRDDSLGKWQLVQDYSTNPNFNWTPSKPGKYRVELHVKDSKSLESFEHNAYKDVVVAPAVAKITSFSSESNLYMGKAYTMKSSGTATNQVLYKYWIKDFGLGTWQVLQDYSTNPNFIWTPSKIGKYRIEVHVKDLYSEKTFDANAYKDVTVSDLFYKAYDITFLSMLDAESKRVQLTYLGGNGLRDATISEVEQYLNPNTFINDARGKYQFLKLNYNEGINITASNIDNLLNGILPLDKNGFNVFKGKGQVFINAAKTYNVNPAYLVAHALHETGNGTSALAKGFKVVENSDGTIRYANPGEDGITVHNFFGIGAVDSNPNNGGVGTAYEYGWTSIDKGIILGAKWISDKYINHATYQQSTLYTMRWNPVVHWHQYATDIAWAERITVNMAKLLDTSGSFLMYEVPLYK